MVGSEHHRREGHRGKDTEKATIGRGEKERRRGEERRGDGSDNNG